MAISGLDFLMEMWNACVSYSVWNRVQWQVEQWQNGKCCWLPRLD